MSQSPPVAPAPMERPRRSRIASGAKVLFIVLLLLAAVFLIGGLFILDGKYDVSRSITIKASPEAIHEQVGDLRAWPKWLPFTKHDTSVVTKIEQPTGVGAKQTWTGKSGNGRLEFTTSSAESGIEFDMVFDEKYASKGMLKYKAAGAETEVTWRMQGQNDDLVGKWFAAVTPYMIGPMFEEGVQDLKKLVEGGATK
ncbi:MAG TPA: SRPBCC family protein [Gemmatales bacterium]|nr:SRPBCC family protein [Gemmatales bacterium]